MNLEGEPKDPLLPIKANFNRWAQATELARQRKRTRLDLIAEPEVLSMVKNSLDSGDLSGMVSTAQLVLSELKEARAREIQTHVGRLDQTLEEKLSGDELYSRLGHQEDLLANGDLSPLSEERIFDATMQYLNEQAKNRENS